MLVATLTEPPSLDGREIAALPPVVDVLEVRADLTGEIDPGGLRDRFPGRLLYTLRSRAEGGASSAGAAERAARLRRASEAGYDLVDLEGERDLDPALLAAVPAARRVISWHGPATDLAGLEGRFQRLATAPALFYKLIPRAERSGEELAPLQLLASLGRRDVVAFAAGDAGLWTRLAAPRLGSPLIYGAVGPVPGAPGQPTVARLVADYGLPAMPAADVVFGIVGNQVAHSLSPRLHNTAYRELGIAALYLPFFARSLGEFWLEVVESPVLEPLGLRPRGLSVTRPFKDAALAVAGASSPLVERIGAANTLVCRDGVWEAESTDPDGVVLPLRQRGLELSGASAVVYGCGGAGRAAAAGLLREGARVLLTNRGAERGRRAAGDLGLPFAALPEVDPSRFDLVVNATPLGASDRDRLPFDPAGVAAGAAVVDMVYRPAGEGETPLVAALRRRRVSVVTGREMLLFQALAQFRMMTGRDLPPELGRRILDLPEVAA